MPRSEFKTCMHRPEAESQVKDWRECWACIDEVAMNLAIARSYLTEIAKGKFNDNGDCVEPVAEPVRGRSYQQIAQYACSIVCDPDPNEEPDPVVNRPRKVIVEVEGNDA